MSVELQNLVRFDLVAIMYKIQMGVSQIHINTMTEMLLKEQERHDQ